MLKSNFIFNKAKIKWPTLNLDNFVTTEDNWVLFFSAESSFQGAWNVPDKVVCAWARCACAPRLEGPGDEAQK